MSTKVSVGGRRAAIQQQKNELRDRLGPIRDEIDKLAESGTLTAGQSDRLERQIRKSDELMSELDRLNDAERELLFEAVESGEYVSDRGHTPSRTLDDDPIGDRERGDKLDIHRYGRPWDIFGDTASMRSASTREWRARALSAIEKAPGLSYSDREAATGMLEEFDDQNANLSRLALATSAPAYLRFFGEMLKSGGSNPILSPEEVEAARHVRAEARAMSLTDTSGGFLIPFQLDPSVIITDDGSFNPIRRVARRVVATGDVWHGVSADATEWSWDGEASEVSDDASTFAQPTITIHKAQGFVPISIEALEDGANATEEIRRLIAFGRNTLEATAFATGSGSQPQGIITALQGVAGSVVNATTNDAYAKEDVYKVDEALPARYRQSRRAAWFANRAIWNDTDLFETSNGSKLFPGVVGNPGTLLGNPTYEMEGMDGSIGTGDDYCLVYGDFDNYVIADRSSSVEFVPHIFGGSQRPTGQRGFYAYFRTGADSVNDGAFRVLKV